MSKIICRKYIRYSLLFLPWVLFSLLSLFFFEDKKELLKEIIAFFLLNSVSYCLVLLLFQLRIRQLIIGLSTIFLNLISIIKIAFIYLYDSKITGSALFVLFETNQKEAFEYLQTYLDTGLFAILALHLICIGTVLYFLKSKEENIPKFSYWDGAFLLMVIVFAIFQINKRFYNQDLFWRVYNAYEGYTMYKQGLSNQLGKFNASQANKVKIKNNDAQTHIVIVGESLTRKHMSLYAYPRKTNPKLEGIKEELLLFDKVISPHTHTITSLEKILTLASFENSKPEENMSVVQMANVGNYDTFWISNQEPIGITETIPTIIGSAAKHKYWMETENFYAQIFDGKLLPQLKRVLKRPEKRKVIFLHLMGTHATYNKRYPKQFDYFKDTPPKAISKERKVTNNVNYYDNAVRYNDFIVHEIIKELEEKNIVSSVTYFSDHGQEVFDEIDFMGHQEFTSTTKAMYEVPLLFWFSEKFKQQSNLDLDLIKGHADKKYILEDFPHTFVDVVGLKFQGYDAEKSIINASFKEKKRIIRNNRDYDKW